MGKPRYEMCPLCEASFVLVAGRFPRHRGIRAPLCPCAEKTLVEAAEIERLNNEAE